MPTLLHEMYYSRVVFGGEDIYGRAEKLVIFTSSPVISLIVGLVWFPPLPH